MTANDWAVLAVETLTIAGIALAGLRWLIKVEMYTIKHELTNNGGSSMKDKVDNNTTRLERVEARVDDIYLLLLNKE